MWRLSIIIIYLTILSCTQALGQSPQAFSYQGVALNQAGEAINYETIDVRINILSGSESGTIVYSEIHSINTQNDGLFSLNIGEGAVENGTFSTIDWADNSFFLEIEIDPTQSNSFEQLSVAQLLSVPYALYAEKGKGPQGIQGPAGPIGPDGPVGPEGDPGDPGIIGPICPVGPIGVQGPAGAAGATGATGAQGPAGANGSSGLGGPTGVMGPAGPTGLSSSPLGGAAAVNCWDTNQNYIADPSEDVNEDGIFNALDCIDSDAGTTGATGPQGPEGPQGFQGPQGPASPQGAQGPSGPDGPDGPQGPDGATASNLVGEAAVFCWDTNGNYEADSEEDTNNDGLFDTSDCFGAPGPQGPMGNTGNVGYTGPQGPAGPAGFEGPAGPQGPMGNSGKSASILGGEAAIHCWDTNGNYIADPAEDVNNDNSYNALDCMGPVGPVGATGATGPKGATGQNGATGAAGPAGPQGPQGPPGAQGIAGEDGLGHWSTDGSNIYFDGGQVGVGAEPSTDALLEVNGDFYSKDIYSNGVVINSDARFKRNIKEVNNIKSILFKISGVSYDFRTEEFPQMNFSDQVQIGLIAQEVEKYFPELVYTKKDGYKTVDYIKLMPLLVQALNEINSDLMTAQTNWNTQSVTMNEHINEFEKLKEEQNQLKEELKLLMEQIPSK